MHGAARRGTVRRAKSLPRKPGTPVERQGRQNAVKAWPARIPETAERTPKAGSHAVHHWLHINVLNRLHIGPRLYVAFTLVIGLAAVVAVVGMSRLSTLTDSLALISSDRLPRLQQVNDLPGNVNLIA